MKDLYRFLDGLSPHTAHLFAIGQIVDIYGVLLSSNIFLFVRKFHVFDNRLNHETRVRLR